MKKALLIVGDKWIKILRPYISFRKFTGYAADLKDRQGLQVEILSYQRLLEGSVPPIKAGKISVVLFFPYKYWNRHIEVYRDSRIYGDKIFGREFCLFFNRVERAIKRHYPKKRIRYLNPPKACCLDRDKQAVKHLLSKNNIPTPRSFRATSFSGIQRLLQKGIALYIKPRFGSMGKGITYIGQQGAFSNFIYRQGKIKSRLSDFNWRFAPVKNTKGLINKLLRRGFICEEAIKPATFKKRRFDFRVYVVFGKVVYLYAKSSPAKFWVTNWSQGGRLDKKKKILRTISQQKLSRVKTLAKRAAGVLRLNFAGVDIIFSHDFKKAYVLEANAFPGNEKGYDLMQCVLQNVVRKL